MLKPVRQMLCFINITTFRIDHPHVHVTVSFGDCFSSTMNSLFEILVAKELILVAKKRFGFSCPVPLAE